MNQFGAEHFYSIACALANLRQSISMHDNAPHEQGCEMIRTVLNFTAKQCDEISLRSSAKFARRFEEFVSPDKNHLVLQDRLNELSSCIRDEMEDQKFFWIPTDRASWYTKDAETLLGKECWDRFPKIIPEVEEAMKCYAVGRYTASAFHLMRATEAAVKALGIAVGLTPAHPGWKLVLDEVWKQYNNKSPRHASWSTHEDFFVTVSADMRAISKVWRNDIAHFVDTYTEEMAKPMFEIVAVFLRDLAKHMDETGKLY